MTSMKRWMRLSVLPPAYPDQVPMIDPRTVAIATPIRPMVSETRPP